MDRERKDTDANASAWDAAPEPVRSRLAHLAAAALGELGSADIPVRLRPVARFAPAKRGKLGLSTLVAALRDSSDFRTVVLEWCRAHRPDQLSLEDPDPAVVATAALLLDSPVARHYTELVSHRVEQGRLRAERDSALARVDKLSADLRRARDEVAEAHRAAQRAGDEKGGEADRLRKRLREQGTRLKAAKDDAELARAELSRAREEADAALAEREQRREREQAKADEERKRAERAVAATEAARESAREARQGDEVRLSLLLETLEGAVGGLRQELGSSGSGRRPAEAVRGVRAWSGEPGNVADLSALDKLLALPAVHVIVDGYNVTKTGYPELPLADQRNRLAHQLAALAARTGGEVTVVFDGANVLAVPSAGPRGVRVLFSDPGVQADDVIRGLVAAEPRGRQIVVATSDQEIVASVRQRGAYTVASSLFLSRIN